VVLDQEEVRRQEADQRQWQDGDMGDEEALEDRRAAGELRSKPDARATQQLPYLLVVLKRLPSLLVPPALCP
jgi:hypothetical protein